VKTPDLGFKVRFDIGSIPVDDIELWTHEFSEMSLMDLLGDDRIINLIIEDVSGLLVLTPVSIPHIMVALHLSSSVLYLDGSEKTFMSDEFAFQILKWRDKA